MDLFTAGLVESIRLDVEMHHHINLAIMVQHLTWSLKLATLFTKLRNPPYKVIQLQRVIAVRLPHLLKNYQGRKWQKDEPRGYAKIATIHLFEYISAKSYIGWKLIVNKLHPVKKNKILEYVICMPSNGCTLRFTYDEQS